MKNNRKHRGFGLFKRTTAAAMALCLSLSALPISGLAAGAISGLFGTGGGMILVPILTALTTVDETDVFSFSEAKLIKEKKYGRTYIEIYANE